jgi:oligopeptide transport system substrate-binding protein
MPPRELACSGKEERKMRRGLLLVGISVLLIPLFWAGEAMGRAEVFVNDSAVTARALRITFSEPAEIVALGDAFDFAFPGGRATTFTLTGGRVEPGWTSWASWIPASARVVRTEWLLTGGGVQLDIAISEDPWTLDPTRLTVEEIPWIPIEQLFLGLVDVEAETGALVPELATAWEVSEDGLCWTFTLRGDATWTDGRPVTALDARCGLLRALSSDNVYRGFLFPITNAEAYSMGSLQDAAAVGIEAIDETHLRIRLDSPCSFLPAILTLPLATPLPAHVVKRYGESWADPDNLITDGPYALVRWEHGSCLTLERRDGVALGETGGIARVNIWVKGAEEAWAEYLGGLLDTAEVPAAYWDSAANDASLAPELQTWPGLQGSLTGWTDLYGFNPSKAPFDQVLIRKAFIASVDRLGLIARLRSIPRLAFGIALTVTPPGSLGHVDPTIVKVGIGYDPEQARAWLAEAGYPEGRGLPPVTAWFNSGNVANQTIAEYLRGEWARNLHVQVEIKGVPWGEYVSERLPSGECQIWRSIPWGMDYPDAFNSLSDMFGWPSDQGVIPLHDALGGWANARYQALLRAATGEPDPGRRESLYAQAERILVEEDAVFMPLYYFGRTAATKPYLHRTFSVYGAPDIAAWHFDLGQ